jgi:hypothetical protein
LKFSGEAFRASISELLVAATVGVFGFWLQAVSNEQSKVIAIRYFIFKFLSGR